MAKEHSGKKKERGDKTSKMGQSQSTQKPNPILISKFDVIWKYGIYWLFQSFLYAYDRQLHDDIDWTQKIVELSTENLFENAGETGGVEKEIADLAFEVFLKSIGEKVIIHIDIQATRQTNFPLRVTKYNLKLSCKHDRKVISIVILIDKDLNWYPNSSELTIHSNKHIHEFSAIKIENQRDKAKELREQNNLVGWFFQAHFLCRDTENNPSLRLEEKVNWIIKFAEVKIDDEEMQRRIYLIFDGLLQLPKELQLEFYQRTQYLKGKLPMEIITQSMIDFSEEIKRKAVKSAEKRALNKGKREGIKEGKSEGIKEGLQIAIPLKYEQKVANDLLMRLSKISDVKTLGLITNAIKNDIPLKELMQLMSSKKN